MVWVLFFTSFVIFTIGVLVIEERVEYINKIVKEELKGVNMTLTLTDREIKALVEKELDKAPQYAFERKVFCDTFREVFGEDFYSYDLFDPDVTYKSFILWHDCEDTWYIYSKQFRVAVSWYKNLGRINKCNNEYIDEIGLQTFFVLLREEYYKSKESK